MAKAKRNKLYIFPLLAVISLLIFVIYKLLFNVFALSIPFSTNLIQAILLDALSAFKNINEHLFPCFLLFTIGITWILLNRLIYKRAFLKKFWVALTLIGLTIILFGGRILFVLTGAYPLDAEALAFILNAFNERALLLTSFLCFCIMFVLQMFDKLYLSAK